MKASSLATLVLRLMGIYFLVQIIPDISIFTSAAVEAVDQNFTPLAILVLFSFIFLIVVGVLLIACSVPWGRKLVAKETDETISPISFKQLQTLAFAIIGILIFADALPQLLSSIFRLLDFLLPENQTPAHDILNHLAGDTGPYLIEYAIGDLLRAALGICLFFGASGFANVWSSMRNFATPKPTQAQ